VSESIGVSDSGSGFSFDHELTVLAPRSDYTCTKNLAKATLKGYGPIHGSASYTGTPAVNGTSNGTLSGDPQRPWPRSAPSSRLPTVR
jgi:hypothetical protein